MNKVFIDWLDVIYVFDDVFEFEFCVFFLGCGFDFVCEFGGIVFYFVKFCGMVKVIYVICFVCIFIFGGVLVVL